MKFLHILTKTLVMLDGLAKKLLEINGVASVFTGPGFLTLTKEDSADWVTINTDILNKFDTI